MHIYRTLASPSQKSVKEILIIVLICICTSGVIHHTFRRCHRKEPNKDYAQLAMASKTMGGNGKMGSREYSRLPLLGSSFFHWLVNMSIQLARSGEERPSTVSKLLPNYTIPGPWLSSFVWPCNLAFRVLALRPARIFPERTSPFLASNFSKKDTMPSAIWAPSKAAHKAERAEIAAAKVKAGQKPAPEYLWKVTTRTTSRAAMIVRVRSRPYPGPSPAFGLWSVGSLPRPF
jgi:hypothetical protein